MDSASIKGYTELISCIIVTQGYIIYDVLLGVKKEKTDLTDMDVIRSYKYLKYVDFQIGAVTHDENYFVLQGYSPKFKKTEILVYKKSEYTIPSGGGAHKNPNQYLFYSIPQSWFFQSDTQQITPQFIKTTSNRKTGESNTFLYVVSRLQGVTLTKFKLQERLFTFSQALPLKYYKDYVLTSLSIDDSETTDASQKVYRLNKLMDTPDDDSDDDDTYIFVRSVWLFVLLVVVVVPICVTLRMENVATNKQKKRERAMTRGGNYFHPYSGYDESVTYDQNDKMSEGWKRGVKARRIFKKNSRDGDDDSFVNDFSSLMTGTVDSMSYTQRNDIEL